MEALLTLAELLKTALGHGAVGFTLRSGLHPVIHSEKGVQTYDSQPSASEDIEDLLRHLITSREMRQYRDTGVVHFRCVFEGISLIGGTRHGREEVRLELRRMAA
jgi:Tfp pilus assembly pilus retraction ATPase PilT